MKLLSFLALFFYLTSLLPSAQVLQTYPSVDSVQNSAPHHLNALSARAAPLKHSLFFDDDDNVILQLHADVVTCTFCAVQSYVLQQPDFISATAFLARAPPVEPRLLDLDMMQT